MKSFILTNVLVASILGVLAFTAYAEAAPNDRRDRNDVVQKKPVPAKYASRGHKVKKLPAGHLGISVGKSRFYYHGGVFYRPQGSVYVVVDAPIGARVRSLPAGFVSFSIGTRRYFQVNATYYHFEPETQEYVVVAEPDGGAYASAAAEPSDQLFVYPNHGQSDEQVRQDRYECYVWASGQSGFDPALADQPVAKQADYDRAISACLEGRGYTVR